MEFNSGFKGLTYIHITYTILNEIVIIWNLYGVTATKLANFCTFVFL